jgi:hypothetical protein
VFYNCRELVFIVGDFSKGLGVAVAAKAIADYHYGMAYLIGTGWTRSFVENDPLPLSLFHPRWFLDELDVLYTRWQMYNRLGELSPLLAASSAARHAGDRYLNRGEGLILEVAAAAAAVAKLKSLPPGQAERLCCKLQEKNR